ncbi:hypothetical protein [Shewanella nanhaiensis]|uniref:Uncharacterized protein n=1 Tax=Shewanella nanhaiensis TaxID=2864872 RepID=A0ABS7E1H7_9GAMM|nr:hypothetical protein [Shewanella nanhaiensis]MBW8183482.1 hypothetical protein [Shewanella nanhaiensis]
MKKQTILFATIIIISSIGSYYFGTSRGLEAGANATTFIFANQAVMQMNQHAILLTTIKNGDYDWTKKLTEALVEHDMGHLEKIEKLLLDIPTDEKSGALIESTLQKTKEMHKKLNAL